MTTNLLAATILALAAGSAGGDDDTVVLRDGTTKSGKIQASEAAGVTLLVGKKSETTPWSAVASLQYGGARDLDVARQAIAEGKRDEGIAALEKLAADKKMRAPLHQEVQFELARAHQAKGDADKALAGWRDLLKSHPNGRYLVSGGYWLTLALIARNDPGGALRAVDELTTDARGANADANSVTALDLLRGRALESQKKWSDAQAAYERVAAAKEMPADLVAMAQLGAARAVQGAGKKDDAVKRYKDLLARRPPPVVSAGAWNGLGDVALEAATPKKEVDGLEEALLAYLHGVVLDTPAPAEPTEELERALAGTVKTLQLLADAENNKERKAALLDRVQRRREEFRKQFPNSPLLPK
jgi:tetratricopeptide (TPR) repeat protein